MGTLSADPLTADSDAALSRRLKSLSLDDPDYWSFRGNAKRDHGHGLMQYPAMMVPQMVRALLTQINQSEEPITRVGDPFVGSGTVLTETTLRGMDFVGRDINPLAILLCRVKAGPIFPEAIQERAEELLARMKGDVSERCEAGFPGINKWFQRHVRTGLSRLRRAIRAEPSAWARRFFWVALAETVRLTSNSRTSTFKLHARSAKELESRRPQPVKVFQRVLVANLTRYQSLATALRENNFLDRGHYSGNVQLSLGDSREKLIADKGSPCDLVITSPPYGDNVTTVPYGQYSYLPLQWIDLADIHPGADAKSLCTTHEIDRRSLGGTRRLQTGVLDDLTSRSPTLKRVLTRLMDHPPDRHQRVVAFVRDLDKCLANILDALRPGGIMVWVLGNRRVGGRSVPLDRMLVDLLDARDARLVTQIRRRIPSKRMAVRNNVADTMANENILVIRKADSNAKIR